MKVNLHNRILFALLLMAHFLNAQDIAFKGGNGDGFTVTEIDDEFLDFTKGNDGDGFTFADFTSTESIFTLGGNGDGHTNGEIEQQFLDFSKGGFADGFAIEESINSFNDMYVGDIGDGFTKVETVDGFNDMYVGGQSDGFAYDKYGHMILWTGISSTSWNAAGNWENGIIPSYCNPVVIPAGAPNFPAVNAGLLRIGYYSNEGDYKCQKIIVSAGAVMTTRANCFVENYDLIRISGRFFVKNLANNAISNIGDGVINIKANAQLIVKE